MTFHRIEPFAHETFYVLAEEDANLDRIASSPICFSPINYKKEIVDAGDIPVHAKIVTFDKKNGKIRRVNLETALHIESGKTFEAGNEISAAIDTLKMAMQRNGLNAPISIELQDANQAFRLASILDGHINAGLFAKSAAAVDSGSNFLINGISFTWSKNCKKSKRSLLDRLRSILRQG
jgi:hypothetical protein